MIDSGADVNTINIKGVPSSYRIQKNDEKLCASSPKFKIKNYGTILLHFKVKETEYVHKMKGVDEVERIMLGMDFMLIKLKSIRKKDK